MKTLTSNLEKLRIYEKKEGREKAANHVWRLGGREGVCVCVANCDLLQVEAQAQPAVEALPEYIF